MNGKAKNNNELVSVIVPVYCMEKYVGRCLDSLLRQSYRNLQIIVVNDGSTDGSLAICQRYADLDDRIQIVNQPNGGMSLARNCGIRHARGTYICFVDADDYVQEDFVKKLYDMVKEYQCDVAMCGYIVKKKYAAPKRNRYKRNGLIDLNMVYQSMITNEKIGNFLWNKIYARCVFENTEFPAGRAYEDIFTTYKLMNNASRICVMPDVLYHYIRRKGSVSNQINIKSLLDEKEAIEERNTFIMSSFPNLKKDCEKNRLKFLAVIFDQISKGYGYTKELISIRREIEQLSKEVKCSEVKYRAIVRCIKHMPQEYSWLLKEIYHRFPWIWAS